MTDSMITILNDTFEDFDNDTIETTETYLTKSKKRAERRKKNITKAKRKRNIDLSVSYSDDPLYKNLHQYSKNKIHCSCPLCAFNHKKHGYTTYTVQDLKRFDEMKNQEEEFDFDIDVLGKEA